MSNEAISWAYRQPLPPIQRFVLVTLADLADESHSCWPGQAYLVARTGASARTVRRALDELEGGGWIRRTTRPIVGGGRRSDRYTLGVAERFEVEPADDPDPEG